MYKHDLASRHLVRRATSGDESYFVGYPQRNRFIVLGLLIGLMVFAVYLFLHTQQFIGQVQTLLTQGVDDPDAAKIRQYTYQVEVLQQKMSVFIADAVETRLHALEKNVAEGRVGDQEIKGIEELKNQVRLLESFTAGKSGHFIDVTQLDHPRFHPVPRSQLTGRNDELLAEIIQLKHLLYVSIASWGVVGLLAGGYWWQQHGRHRALPSAIVTRHLLSRYDDSRTTSSP